MIDAKSLDLILRNGRTHNVFLDKPVSDEQLRAIHEIMKWGPTTMNTQPARFVFVRTKEGKEKLRPALSPGNLDKTMAAPVTAIVAYDPQFYEFLPKTFPHNPAANNVGARVRRSDQDRLRNGSLQGAYLLIAARALGLDTGADVGFRQCEGGRRLLSRRALEVEFPLQPRQGRPRQALHRTRG